jgi:adenylate cyclase
MNKKFSHHLAIGAGLGLTATLLVAIVTYFLWPGLFGDFEAKSLDWRYMQRLQKLWERRQGAAIEDIMIVDIDNRSLEKLGRFDQWPRDYHSQLIDYVTEGGALAIGFDVLFMEADKARHTDSSLIASTAKSGIVYHSMAFSMADPDAFLYAMQAPPIGFEAEKYSLILPRAVSERSKHADRMDGKVVNLYNAAAGIGFANFSPDNDSVIRTMPLFLTFADHQYAALSLSIVAGVLGVHLSDLQIVPGKEIILNPPGSQGKGSIRIPINEKNRMLINYQGTFQTFRYISYYDVLMQRLPKETFEGKIVLVGTSAAGLSDIRPVPFQDAFPGVEVHANIIHNILSQQFITRQSGLFAFINFLLLAIIIALLAIFLKPWLSGLLMVVLSGGYGYLAGAWFAADAYWLELVRPALAILFAFLFVYMYRYIDEERSKRYIKGMFQHYLTASVVDELLRRPDMLQLGGERRIATAFFSDIKNFTTVSESLPPEELVAQLNEYLAAMTEVVLKYEGYLDKYEGDAIMAIFGVPVDQADHAERTCLAALEMQAILLDLRKRWQEQEKPKWHVRMGINSGPMIAGNIGGKDRFDYTVIGDSVNLASRLEGANKTYNTQIMISEFTKELLNEEWMLRELDLLQVKGKTKPVRVFELMAENRSKLANSQLLLLDEYQKGLQAYRSKKWKEATACFERALLIVPDDGPSKTYVERCAFYQKNPVPLDWDGVFEMKTK